MNSLFQMQKKMKSPDQTILNHLIDFINYMALSSFQMRKIWFIQLRKSTVNSWNFLLVRGESQYFLKFSCKINKTYIFWNIWTYSKAARNCFSNRPFQFGQILPQNRQLFWNLKYLLSNDQYDGTKLADFDQNFFGWYLDTYVLANAI